MRTTAVELDLFRYTERLQMLEENLGTQASAALDQQIQNFIDAGLQVASVPREDAVLKTTGDGAVLLFDSAEKAHGFAVGVHEATCIHNADKTELLAKRWFRIGAATGEIALVQRDDGTRDAAGMVLVAAVRLEAAAGPGQLLVDQATYDAFPADLRRYYSDAETIPGKHGAMYTGHRCVMVAEAEVDGSPDRPVSPAEAPGDRRAILEMMDAIYPDAVIEELIFLIEMSPEDQPPPRLTVRERRAAVLQWAASPAGCGLGSLESELQYLIATKYALPVDLFPDAEAGGRFADANRRQGLVDAGRNVAYRDRVLGRLERELGQQPDPDEKHWIYLTLGGIGGRKARDLLRRGLQEADGWARRGAEIGMGLLSDS